jgi:hypothetical protein
MGSNFGSVGLSTASVASGLGLGIALLLQTALGSGLVSGTPTGPSVILSTSVSSVS